MLSRHLPLITNRIHFASSAMAPLPAITPRVNLQLFGVNISPGSGNPAERELTPSENSRESSPENKPNVDDGESELSELSELESDIGSDEALRPAQKIPKPSGEPGRPNSGGYSIEDVLVSWGKDEFGKVTKFTKKLADAKLDQTKSYGKQDHTKVNRLCETVARNHPIVDKYEDYWPVRGMLKMHLKASSESYRREVKQQRGVKGKKIGREV